MSEMDRLAGEVAAATNGATLPPADICERLTATLGLAAAKLAITGAEVYGRGAQARVRIRLNGSEPIIVERFADLAKPAVLSAILVTTTGVYKTFKGPDAGAVAAMIFRLAEHHAQASEEEVAREWGLEFLRIAAHTEADLSDQLARWRAFSDLARREPARDAGEDRSAYALAAASVVLVAGDGRRYVRAGWFKTFVRRENALVPVDLRQLMQSVGWEVPGGHGRVKATSPEGRALSWNFYVVPLGWEQV